MSIKLLFDARKIFDGGIGVYSQNIIEACCLTPEIQVSLLINPEQESELQARNFGWLSSTSLVKDPAPVRSLDEYFSLADRINFREYDLYHTPYITLPFEIPIAKVITIHDLIQITHPEKIYYPLVAKVLLGNSIRRATGVLTVSESSADSLRQYFGRTLKDKLRVISNVISPVFASDQQQPEPQIIKDPFLLAVFSNLKPHKGLANLVTIFGELEKRSEFPENIRLVLVGKELANLGTDSDVAQKIQNNPRITNLGMVSDRQLGVLYQQADALIVSSYVEGFCLQVLQSHAYGTPVISRPVPAVQELLTKDDSIAKDFSDQALTEAILNFYQNPIIGKSSYDLSDYDLSKLSDKLVSYYQSVLDNWPAQH